MHFDDRLATVLKSPVGGEVAARTQFRQLLDLLGSSRPLAGNAQVESAFIRLDELSELIPAQIRSQILREPGLRLRNPELVEWLANHEGQVAASAMAAAKLGETEWLAIIPRLPVSGRGFLRHRRDLPQSVLSMLERLGVGDLVLPEPPGAHGYAPLPQEPLAQEPEPLDLDAFETAAETPAQLPPQGTAPTTAEEVGIGALVRRIEEFRKARDARPATTRSPRLPFAPPDGDQRPYRVNAFDFATDARGRIRWADPAVAPMAVGFSLNTRSPQAPVKAPPQLTDAIRRHQPIINVAVELEGAPAIDGPWRIDAMPQFSPDNGSYTGYRGRMRRPTAESAAEARLNRDAEVMRQMLHEMRTPVNAIQGFAEIIQQQVFGPAPNEYRALAAAIAVDAARLLAGFEDLDRLAKLESGAMTPEEGEADFRATVSATVQRLEGALRSRSSGFDLSVVGTDFTIPLDLDEARVLAWRVLGTLAGRVEPGERIGLTLASDAGRVRLRAELPKSLAEKDDIFSGNGKASPSGVSAGMFGTGFTLRLARSEATALGGLLQRVDEALLLELPLLTEAGPQHSETV